MFTNNHYLKKDMTQHIITGKIKHFEKTLSLIRKIEEKKTDKEGLALFKKNYNNDLETANTIENALEKAMDSIENSPGSVEIYSDLAREYNILMGSNLPTEIFTKIIDSSYQRVIHNKFMRANEENARDYRMPFQEIFGGNFGEGSEKQFKDANYFFKEYLKFKNPDKNIGNWEEYRGIKVPSKEVYEWYCLDKKTRIQKGIELSISNAREIKKHGLINCAKKYKQLAGNYAKDGGAIKILKFTKNKLFNRLQC